MRIFHPLAILARFFARHAPRRAPRHAPRRAALFVSGVLATVAILTSACGGAVGGDATGTGASKQRTGTLAINVAGLPSGAAASITVSGPGGYTRAVAATESVDGLPPGQYAIAAAEVSVGDDRFGASPAAQSATVTAGITATTSVDYQILTGSIATSISGLPAGATPSVTVAGPNAFARTIAAGTTLGALAPGAYRLTPAPITVAGMTYTPIAPTVDVAVAASLTPVPAALPYAITVGQLAVTVGGLPAGVPAAVTVAGPSGFTRTLSTSTMLSDLVPGAYTVSAAAITSGTVAYTPAPLTQGATVTSGSTAGVTVSYTAGAIPPLNLTIDGMHIQQVVQTYAGTVPMVAGRDGLLRVFVKASTTNSATPAVRVRFYSGTTLASTVTINAASATVPQAITEGTLASSWNYTIPAALMQPGLSILADVDPANSIAESSESDNSYPASGTPAAIDVRNVPAFSVRFVPVLQSTDGLQGRVSAANASSYSARTRAIYPLATVDADVRAPFSTSAPPLQTDDANGAWSQILSEINALRAADGSARNYYGVVKTSYNSGIAGLGYVPGRAAIGWDFLPSASNVMAHELGHNFGRFHAPGCAAAGTDASYPQPDGKIGVFGYDIATNTLKSPSSYYDLMGYCTPAWISDYTYNAVLSYRASYPFMAAMASGGTARRGLLVWGRVQHGQVILEPTYEVDAPPSLPPRAGPVHVQGFGPLGEPLFDLSFDGDQPADSPDPTARHFAFVIPLDALHGVLLTRLRATTGGRQVELRSASTPTTQADLPTAERLNARAVRLRWHGGATRGVLVRDSRTGEILTFGRGGEAVVYTAEGSVDVTTSDGVLGTRQRVGIAGAAPPPKR